MIVIQRIGPRATITNGKQASLRMGHWPLSSLVRSAPRRVVLGRVVSCRNENPESTALLAFHFTPTATLEFFRV
jgi:hypothetical protein